MIGNNPTPPHSSPSPSPRGPPHTTHPAQKGRGLFPEAVRKRNLKTRNGSSEGHTTSSTREKDSAKAGGKIPSPRALPTWGSTDTRLGPLQTQILAQLPISERMRSAMPLLTDHFSVGKIPNQAQAPEVSVGVRQHEHLCFLL